VTVYGGPPIDGLGTTEASNSSIKDRTTATRRISCKRSASRSWLGATTRGAQGPGNSSRRTPPGCTWTSIATSASRSGVQASDVFSALQVYLGSYYVNNFNQFGRTWQVNVQADPLYRTRRPRHPPAPGAQSDGADDPVGLPAVHPQRRWAGIADALQHCTPPPPSPARRRRARARGGDRQDGGDCRSGNARETMAREWTEWRTCKSRRGTRRCSSSPWRWRSSF